MRELIPNVRFQIGKGSLNIFVDEICERKDGPDRSQCDIYLSGFRIVHLDDNGSAIEGKVLAFEEADAPKVARLLAMVLWDIDKGTLKKLPVELEDYSVVIDSPNDADIRIARGNTNVVISGEDMTELAGKLMVIVGSIPYRSA